jgi:ferrous iron transport protein A
MATPKTIADLKPGETGIIKGFNNEELSLKLLEMGCLPGMPIIMSHSAPLGCPICISVGGCLLSMRKEEAEDVVLQ